jgi:hypothetical protein
MDFLAACMQSARRKHVDGRSLLPWTSVADAAVHHSSIIDRLHELPPKTVKH